MPAFHCPLGSPFYDGEDCILCDLCIATTREEMEIATEKIRKYMRAQARKRQSDFRKVAVCGKGGVGKSTITTLVTNTLREEGYKVLVIDTDESNPGLYRMFGFDKEPKPLLKLLSRFSIGEPEPDTEWITRDKIAIRDIPAEYILSNDSLKFTMAGKIINPFQGCACTMGDITRDLVGKLQLEDGEIVLVDVEAGVESFGRGLERYTDTVLIVVEPSFESIALAEKINYLADGIGVQRVRAILNKVPSEEIGAKMTEALARKNVSMAGLVHLDPKVTEAGFEGKPLGASKAKEEVKEIVRRLLSDKAA